MKPRRMTPRLKHINQQQKTDRKIRFPTTTWEQPYIKKSSLKKQPMNSGDHSTPQTQSTKSRVTTIWETLRSNSNDIEGAIRSYKNALRLNPGDLDAKHNLELALERLEQKSQQNRSESGEEDKEQQEQDQQQENQDQQDADEKESNQQDQEDPSESEQQEQSQESSEQEAAAEESPPQSEQESTQQPVKMSKEDAIRLLEAIKDNEKEIQKKILQKRFSRRQRSEKDW